VPLLRWAEADAAEALGITARTVQRDRRRRGTGWRWSLAAEPDRDPHPLPSSCNRKLIPGTVSGLHQQDPVRESHAVAVRGFPGADVLELNHLINWNGS
jgi:hypothetical protein